MNKEKQAKELVEIQEFLHKHKNLLFIVANPRTDLVVVGYGDKYSTVQFPFTRVEDGIVFNALRQSRFNEAIDPLMLGIEKASGISVEQNQQLSHIIGGSIKSIGKAREDDKRSILQGSNK